MQINNGNNKKYALVTGGSSGLGFAFAMNLAKQGFMPILIARDSKKLEIALANIKEKGFESIGFCGDITSAEDLESIANEIKTKCGSLDFLVLNAGVVNVKLLADYTDMVELKKCVEIDLIGTILSTRIFLPLLKTGSRILLISSAFGIIGGAGYSTYCAAKAGVIMFAEALRRELLPKNISVYVACPADVDTPQYEYEQKSSPDWLKAASGRKSLLSPDLAAMRILAKCKGKNQIIFINSEIKLLNFLNKILPQRLKQFVGDISVPRPR